MKLHLTTQHYQMLGLGISAVGVVAAVLYYKHAQAGAVDNSGSMTPLFQSAAIPSFGSGNSVAGTLANASDATKNLADQGASLAALLAALIGGSSGVVQSPIAAFAALGPTPSAAFQAAPMMGMLPPPSVSNPAATMVSFFQPAIATSFIPAPRVVSTYEGSNGGSNGADPSNNNPGDTAAQLGAIGDFLGSTTVGGIVGGIAGSISGALGLGDLFGGLFGTAPADPLSTQPSFSFAQPDPLSTQPSFSFGTPTDTTTVNTPNSDGLDQGFGNPDTNTAQDSGMKGDPAANADVNASEQNTNADGPSGPSSDGPSGPDGPGGGE